MMAVASRQPRVLFDASSAVSTESLTLTLERMNDHPVAEHRPELFSLTTARQARRSSGRAGQNNRLAWAYVAELATKQCRPTEMHVRGIHARLFKQIDDINAGRYRTTRAAIDGSPARLPLPAAIPGLMAEFGERLAQPDHRHDDIVHASRMHYELVRIHPFVDGNGRTARLLMNLLLILANRPPAIITSADR